MHPTRLCHREGSSLVAGLSCDRSALDHVNITAQSVRARFPVHRSLGTGAAWSRNFVTNNLRQSSRYSSRRSSCPRVDEFSRSPRAFHETATRPRGWARGALKAKLKGDSITPLAAKIELDCCEL